MANSIKDAAVQRRRLRVELRTLRNKANLTQREVAKAMDWSSSKLIRMENGDVRIGLTDLRVLLDHYGVTDKRRVDQLIDMARSARDDPWAPFRDYHSSQFLSFLAFEASCSIERNYELSFVPGLAQTEEYAMAVYRAVGVEADTAERRWEARLRRQEVHERDEPPEVFLIVDEGVVSRSVGGVGVMRRQLERLAEIGGMGHVTLQLLPFDAGEHPSMDGSFIVLEFDDAKDDTLLYLEDPAGGTIERDDPDVTSDYIERFFALEDLALSPEDTLAWFDRRVDALKRRSGTSVPAAKEDSP